MHSGFTGPVQHDLIQRADGFAEVFPEHKYQVVEMLQQRGSLTAMTGDGKPLLKPPNLLRDSSCRQIKSDLYLIHAHRCE